MNYKSAVETLGKRASRKLGNNTYLRLEGNAAKIKLHNTDVITLFPNGDTELNSGGWKTLTTRERMNAYGDGFSVKQENRVWYIETPKGRYCFKDGCVVKSSGEVIGTEEGADEKQAKAIKSASAYARGYVKSFAKGEIPAPSGGDCWYCALHTESGESLGDVTKDKSHIEGHIQEKYYVPSLLVNAIKVFPVSRVAEHVIASKWQGAPPLGNMEEIALEQIKKSIYRYVLRQMGLAS
jgi:hypothetical protein